MKNGEKINDSAGRSVGHGEIIWVEKTEVPPLRGFAKMEWNPNACRLQWRWCGFTEMHEISELQEWHRP